MPDDSADYDLGPITDNSGLNQVVAITKHKLIGYSSVTLVQHAITLVTDGNPLDSATLDGLNRLPEAGLDNVEVPDRPVSTTGF